MQVKEFFEKGQTLDIEIKVLQKAVEEALALNVKDNITASYVKKLKDRIVELEEYRQKMLNAINKLDDAVYRELLTQRYILGNSWDYVAEKLGFSEVWTRTSLLDEALKEVVI